MKRLVFCFDGTWNQLSADVPTNVARIAQMVLPVTGDGTHQVVYYDEGIGTQANRVRKLTDGAFGWGMLANIREAYRFLIFNYEPGDQIYAFGFSRGAYTARSFLGFIRHAGILDIVSANKIDKAIEIYRDAPAGETGKESGLALRFRASFCKGVCVSEVDREFRCRLDPALDLASLPLLDIRYLGAWDTVRSLGLPNFVPGARLFNRKYKFHDAVLTSKIKAARHAVAIDEARITYRPELFGPAKVAELNRLAQAAAGRELEEWERPYLERWFPGVHGAVGGGGARRGLSDAALAWVLAGAKRAGLVLRSDADAKSLALAPDPLDAISNRASSSIMDKVPLRWLRRPLHSPRAGPASVADLALAALQRWFAPPSALPDGQPWRPGTLAPLSAAIDQWPHAQMPEYKSEHVVMRDETLTAIARDRMGDGWRWREIFDANRDRLDDPDHIMVGTRLRIPDTVVITLTRPARKARLTRPPRRRPSA